MFGYLFSGLCNSAAHVRFEMPGACGEIGVELQIILIIYKD
jgi:hypothetical protein